MFPVGWALALALALLIMRVYVMSPSDAEPRTSPTLAARTLVICGVVAGVVLCALIVVKAYAVFAMLFAAIVLGETLRPLADRLSRHMNRAIAILLTFVMLVAVCDLAISVPIKVLLPQFALFLRSLPSYAGQVAALVQHWLGGSVRDQIVRAVEGNAAPLGLGLLQVQQSLAGAISAAVLIILMAAFWLSSSDALRTSVLTLISPNRRAQASQLFDALGGTLTTYAGGVVVNGAIVALISTIVLWILHAPYPIVLGLLQGALVAVPYLGTLIAVIVAGSVVLAAQGWQSAAIAIALLSIAEGLEGSFISPLVFKQRLNLDPLATVVATAIGGALGGIPGVVLAVPVAALLQTGIGRVQAAKAPAT